MIERPAISVIIPMYNAENFIAQCLGSVLNQTFKNFEVIVVDDCSTDRSVEIVDAFVKRHGDPPVHVIRCRKNSGGAGAPRNVGIRFSRGKYLAFIDSDDLFTPTALEEFYTIAEQTGADVLHGERYFISEQLNVINPGSRLIAVSMEVGPYVNKVERLTDDIGERINLFARGRLFWLVWQKFFRRDFITANDLQFPAFRIGEDLAFSFFCMCLAKNYFRIPNIVNIYRARKPSPPNHSDSAENILHKNVKALIDCASILDEFMDGLKFFNDHPEFKHIAINYVMQYQVMQTIETCINNPPHVIENMLRKQFAANFGGNAELFAQLFNLVNLQQFHLSRQQQIISELRKQLAKP